MWKETDANYQEIRKTLWVNELTFRDGENFINHTITQDISSGQGKCK